MFSSIFAASRWKKHELPLQWNDGRNQLSKVSFIRHSKYRNVLVADVEAPAEFVKQTLESRCDHIQTAHTLVAALKALKERQYDLIICGMHFDESRMIEFLWRVKELNEYKHVPFLCIRALWAHAEFTESVAAAHSALGSSGFLEMDNMGPEGAKQLIDELEKLQATCVCHESSECI